MKIESINNLRIMAPDDGLWLYNETIGSSSKLVYLGVDADENEWVEITDEQKTALESLQEILPESEISTEIEQKAQAYDIITGGVE